MSESMSDMSTPSMIDIIVGIQELFQMLNKMAVLDFQTNEYLTL
jgi:hypothetical protein